MNLDKLKDKIKINGLPFGYEWDSKNQVIAPTCFFWICNDTCNEGCSKACVESCPKGCSIQGSNT